MAEPLKKVITSKIDWKKVSKIGKQSEKKKKLKNEYQKAKDLNTLANSQIENTGVVNSGLRQEYDDITKRVKDNQRMYKKYFGEKQYNNTIKDTIDSLRSDNKIIKKANEYDNKKEELKEEKKNTLFDYFKSWLSYQGARIAKDGEDSAERQYESAKSNYKSAKKELDNLKEDKYYTEQAENQEILKNNNDVAKLVKEAYETQAKKDAELDPTNMINSGGMVKLGTGTDVSRFNEAYQKLIDIGYSQEKANSLIDTYSRQVNAKDTEELKAKSSEFADKHPVLSRAAYVAAQTGNVAAVPDMLKNGVENAISGDYKPLDVNSPAYSFTNFRNAVSEKNTENLYNYALNKTGSKKVANVVTLLDSTGLSLADMLSVSYLPEPVALAIMSCDSAAMTAVDATNRGLSADKAVSTAIAAGAAEAVFEKISLGNFKAFQASGRRGVLNAVKDILKQTFTEGSEEAFTDVANAITDQIINGDNSAIMQEYQSYINSGLNEREAQKKTATSFGKQVGEDFIGGAISGGVAGGVGVAARKGIYNQSNYKNIGESIKNGESNAGDAQAVINNGLASQDKNSRAYKIASKLDKGNITNDVDVLTGASIKDAEYDYKKTSSSKLGELAIENNRQIIRENLTSAVSEDENGEKISKVFKKLTTASNMTKADAKAIRESEVAVSALNAELGTDFTGADITKEALGDIATGLAYGETDFSYIKTKPQKAENATDLTGRASNVSTVRKSQIKINVTSDQVPTETYNIPVTAVATGKTAYISSTKPVTIRGNEVTLNTPIGEVNYSDVNIPDNDTRVILDYVAGNDKIGDTGANTIYRNFNKRVPNATAEQYVQQADLIYQAGLANDTDFNTYINSHPQFRNSALVLGEGAENIYRSAQTDRQAFDKAQQALKEAKTQKQSSRKGTGTYKNETATDSDIEEVLKTLADVTGYDYKTTSDTKSNGHIIHNIAETYISNETGKEYQTAIHENVHYVKEHNAEDYENLRNAVLGWYKENKGNKKFNDIKQKYADVYIDKDNPMTSADIEEELVADGIAAIFTTDEGVEQFAEYVAKKSEPEKKSIVKAFKKLVAHIVDTIKKALSRGNLTQYQKEYLEMEKEQAEHIRTLFLDSLDKASENYKSEQKNNTDKGDVKYSFGVSQSEINDYVEAAYAKENTEDYKKYAEPSERLLNDVANEIDIDGYSHALRDNDIRHIRNSHGEETNEKYPVTKDDIKLIPWIVENYDKVIVKTNAKNQPGIVYVKVMPDNIIYYVEAVTEEYHKEKLLINKQMLKVGIDEIPNLHGLIAAINKKTSSSQYLADLEKIRKAYVRDVKENYSNDILPRNYKKSSGNAKYSLSPAELDKQYLSAVKNNDTETAQKIVDDVAKENGYNSPVLYHGTHSFGFTTFDLEKMDDKRSIFLTSNPNIASTYSGVTGTKNIGNGSENISNMSADELVNALNEYDAKYKSGTTEDAHRYELYDLRKTNNLIESVNTGIESLKNLVEVKIKNYADKMAADFEEKDAKIHRQLVNLLDKLENYSYDDLSTPIYLLLHHTDVFNGSTEIATLEKNIRLMNQLRRNQDVANGVIVDETLGGYVIELMSIDEAKQQLKNRLKQGNYSLYAKLGKSLVIDGNGQLWKDIRYWTSNIEIEPADVSVIKKDGFYWIVNNETNEIIPSGEMAVNSFTDELYLFNKNRLRALIVDKANQILRINTENINTTRGISKFAQEQGYDSVVFKNIRDNGGMNTEVDYDEVADIYVIFDPNSIKSADAVTYDDNGNVIPLSERFKADNNDIRYSKDVDSDGNTLSEQQQEYFKDSKVRDEDGKLLVVYHGTSEDFTVFDREKGRSNMDIQGSFFSPWELDARGYGANVRAFYLNITNPASEALAYKALRKFQGQNNAGLKAREYLERLGYDGVNNGNEEYIAFYSNQIKNVDNINPTDNDDIRFSKDVDNINELKRENKKLKEANELLRHEFELTGGLETSLSSATNIGIHINKTYNTSISGAEIGRDIKAMCDRVMQDEYRSYDTLYDEARAIAKKIVDNKKKEISPENQAVVDDIRSTAVKLSESQKKEVAYYYGSYGNFRRSNLKNINISNDGIPLDIRYQELKETYPGLFTKAAEPDEPIAIVEIVDTLINSVENDYGYDADELTDLVTNDIIEAYFNVGTHKTFADKKQREINLIRSQYSNQIQKIKEQKKKDYQKALKDVADLKGKVRNLKQEHSRALIEMRKAEREKIRDTRERAKTRESIRRCLLKLATLSKQTKKKHIPDNMIKAIKELINAITFDTQTDVVLSERIKNLDDSFRNPKDENDENDVAENRSDLDEHSNYAYITQLYNDYVLAEITSLQNSIGNKVLRDIELKDLKKIDELIRMTLAKINHMNNMYGYERNKSIEGSANKVIEEIENLDHKNVDVSDSKYKLIREATKMKSSLKYGSMKPEYFFEYLGSDELLERYKEVRKGEDTWAVTISDAKKSANEIREKYGWKDWNFKKEFEYTTLYGKDIKLNLGHIMGMYAMNLRKQTRQHLLEGGFEFKTKNNEESKDKENYKVTEHDVRKITDNLTLEQKEYVQDMIEYLSTEMAEKGNEVSRQLYDVELFKEPVYYPAHVDKKYLQESSKEFKGTKKIINSGMTNATIENAVSPIYLEDFDEVWAGHVDEMAKYNAFAIPLENFDRVYNFVTKDGNEYTSVKQNIEKYYSSKATKYINDLLEDLNGGVVREAGSDIADKWTSLFKKNAVFASASVVVQQPSAIGRALCMIDSKYFAKTTITKRDYEELKKYAPVAIIKEMGYFDTNMAQSTVDYLNNPEYTGAKEKATAFFTDRAYRDEKLSYGASKADELTWCHIWNACKAEAFEKYSNLTKEEQLQKAGEKFTDVITKTQVYDSVFSRSALMRSKNGVVKMATAFMAEPTTSLNMFVNSLIQAKRGKISKAQAGKVFGSLMAASILNTLLQSLVTAGRDDDEDEKYGEKYIAQLLPNFIDNANPLNQISFVKDIISIFKGYDVSRADMNVIDNLENALDKMSSDSLSIERKIENLAGAIGALFGLPVKNVMRDMRSAWNIGNSFFNGRHFNETALQENFKGELKDAIVSDDILAFFGLDILPEKDKSQLIYEAIKNGDDEMYSRIADNVSNPDKYIKEGLIENDSRITEAGTEYSKGEITALVNTSKELEAEGFDYDLVVKTIKSYANKLNETEESSKKSKLYNADDLYNAVNSGNQSTIDEVISSNKKIDMENGKTEEEAEKSIKSSLTTKFKEEYLEANDNQKAQIQNKLNKTGLFTDDEYLKWKSSAYNTDTMVEAFESNDTKQIQEYVSGRINAKIEAGMTKDNAVSGIKSSISNQYKEKFINGNADTRANIITIMTKTGLYGSRTDVIAWINKYWLK